MLKKAVTDLLQVALDERQDLFLIDFTIGADNKINIIIDGDKGVTVEDCIFVSRAIEHNLDREEEDFSLDVASAGASAPLTLQRQYLKNIGRELKVKTQNETVEGKLVEASKEAVLLKWKTREKKPVGKGKVTVEKEQNIAYSEIVEAKVIIKF